MFKNKSSLQIAYSILFMMLYFHTFRQNLNLIRLDNNLLNNYQNLLIYQIETRAII